MTSSYSFSVGSMLETAYCVFCLYTTLYMFSYISTKNVTEELAGDYMATLGCSDWEKKSQTEVLLRKLLNSELI
jgi:hypothetical protein